jgi:hypothetical protein
VTHNEPGDRARQRRLKVLVALAILSGAAVIMAIAALYVVSVRPGVPELVPGQQRAPPLLARIRL